MKRYLILLFLLLASPAWACDDACSEPMTLARMSPAMLGSGVSAAAIQTDSCTDGLLLSWHCEDADVTQGGVGGGVNNGCSAGDTTASASSSAAIDAGLYHDGAKSCDFPTAADYYSFSVTDSGNGNGDIMLASAGTLDFWIYFTALGNYQTLFTNYTDASNKIYCQLNSTSTQIQGYHVAGGTTRNTPTNISGDLQTETWYHFKFRWGSGTCEGTAGQTICVCIDTTDGTTNCGKTSAALGAWAGSMATIKIGGIDSVATDFHVDNVRIYSSWQ